MPNQPSDATDPTDDTQIEKAHSADQAPAAAGATRTTALIANRQARLAKEFQVLGNWEERYKRIIERGRRLPPPSPELHNEKYKVRGCQSQVWLHARLNADQSIHFEGDSDALIVKGLVAVLIEVFSDASADEILAADTGFLKSLGLEGHLSPSRANGLFAMLKQILYYAQAFRLLSRASTKDPR